jgi:simple sugar transport system permease protein
MGDIITPFLMQSAVQAITPILLAALAGVLCGRVGVFNMALEGQMLIGAFAAIVGSFYFGSALAGIAAAIVAVVVFSLILAYGATVFRGDPVVICIGMNLLASGLTAYLLRQMFGVSGTFSDPAIVGLDKIRIAALQAIPVIGWGFGRQTAITWLAWILVAFVAVFLFRTAIGLRLRGVGEQPDAAETLGIDVTRYRVVTVLAAGALCGLAGAQLSLGTVDIFSEDMSAGRGWIAVVAVMLARDNPLYAAGACVLFGFADALSIRLQSEGLPNQVTDMAPYAVTLAALVISHRRRRRAAVPSAELAVATAGGAGEAPPPDTR